MEQNIAARLFCFTSSVIVLDLDNDKLDLGQGGSSLYESYLVFSKVGVEYALYPGQYHAVEHFYNDPGQADITVIVRP